MQQNRPRARKKYVGGGAQTQSTGGRGYGSYGGGGSGLLKIILALLVALGGGGGALSGGLGGLFSGDSVASTISYGNGVSSNWITESNSGRLNTTVSSAARDKFTNIKGNGKDTVTLMIYMCGTDLESKSGMATSDLNEMLSANISNNVNVIVYTGGCSSWRNSTISSQKNQIWQITSGKIKCLDKNAGTGSMTDPSTLKSFVKWANKNFPANRRELILWDHGGGSASGFGYDEKNARSGSMTLDGINKALSDAGVKFDFIGFDACLMATAETAIMLGDKADYLIASEETEPGIGWYYTDWLNTLSKNTSTSTLKLGQEICDSFAEKCQTSCRGQQTTLSVVDLAELSKTLPMKLKNFAGKTSDLIEDGDYQSVANARSGSREFARTSGIDQIDLAHFALKTDTSEGKALADVILEAVKYNRVSSSMTNAYGLSIYFPYQKLSSVDKVTDTYDAIGVDDSYTSCIVKFAQMQVSGQAASGGSFSPFGSLSGNGYSSAIASQAVESLVHSLLSGSGRSIEDAGIEGLDRSNSSFMSTETLDPSMVADYVASKRFDETDLEWQKNNDGDQVIKLTEDQWSLVQGLDMGMFYDNGSSYVDLGLDNVFGFDDDGNMIPEKDRTWLAINGQPVAYYHDETLEKGAGAYEINGHVPVKLNGQHANLILVFDDENERGYIAGVRYDYGDTVTDTTAKTMEGLNAGDKIEFIYDTYSYSGKKKESVAMGDPITVTDLNAFDISNVDVGHGDVKITYRFTDIFGKYYWSESLSL